MIDAAAPGGRAVVMYVFNPCTYDTRVLREAASLAAAGRTVTVAATLESGLPRGEVRGGARILRFPGRSSRAGPLRRLTRYLGLVAWSWRVARAGLRGDVHHAHDLPVLPLAWLAARRQRARLVYDSHELFLEAGRVARIRGPGRCLLAALEGRLARRADLVVTVNEAIAAELATRHRLPRPPLVVMNCPPLEPLPGGPDPLRAAAGIAADRPVVLYTGGFLHDRGLELLADAFLEPPLQGGADAGGAGTGPGAALVFLGFGPLEGELRRRAADPRWAGRLFVLPPVEPGLLLDWTRGGDVGVIAFLPVNRNNELASPNKLFEYLMAGVPVVASDLPVMAAIVRETGTGATFRPGHARSLAEALAGILALGPVERAALRTRCRAAAEARYHWEREAARLVAAYAGLTA